MKYKLRSKSPDELEIEYHEEILREFEKIFDVKLRSNYLSDINTVEYFITDFRTGKNKVMVDGCDCYLDSIIYGKTMIEVSLMHLFRYLENIYGIKEEPQQGKTIIAYFDCPNCGAPVEPRQKTCDYCGTHFNYIGG